MKHYAVTLQSQPSPSGTSVDSPVRIAGTAAICIVGLSEKLTVASRFQDFPSSEVEELRLRDRAVVAIQRSNQMANRLTFDWLRANFGRQNGTRDSLDRGRAVLLSADQLDQYLHSYGLMIKSQWQEVCSRLEYLPSEFRLVDYGCGQGLAGLLLSDFLGRAFADAIDTAILVEPSEVALVRAEAVYRRVAPKAFIRCVRKRFDDLSDDDLSCDRNLETVHIFSNVLDIATFDHFQLFGQALGVCRTMVGIR